MRLLHVNKEGLHQGDLYWPQPAWAFLSGKNHISLTLLFLTLIHIFLNYQMFILAIEKASKLRTSVRTQSKNGVP